MGGVQQAAGADGRLQNGAAAGAAAGAATAALGTSAIAKALYGTDDYSRLGETEKQTISTLGTLAAGLAGGLAGDGGRAALAGAQSGKNTSENNDMFSLPKGMIDYGQASSTLGTSMKQAGATAEEINAALSKNAKGDLPEGANITKVIVDGYKDGVLIMGAAYLGPAASVGKMVGGALISEIANGTYQWFDLSQPGNENKTWDYKASAAAGITGALAPGRGVWQNVAIGTGGAIFSDGVNVGSVGGAASGSLIGGSIGEYAPIILTPMFGNSSGLIGNVSGSVAGEIISNKIKDKINNKDDQKDE